MTGNPSLSIDYYRKVLSVEKKNKQALSELALSQEVLRNMEAATLAMQSKAYREASLCDTVLCMYTLL